MKKQTSVVIAVVVLVVLIAIAAVVFFDRSVDAMLGLNFGASIATTTPATVATTTPEHGGMRGGFVMGSIAVLNDNGFTLSLVDGSTKTVTLTATTTIQSYATASSTPTTITTDQLSVGEQVFVIGMPAPDGSITARVVRTGTFPTIMSHGKGAGPGSGGGLMQPE